LRNSFLDQGWLRFPADPETSLWAAAAAHWAAAAARDPGNAHWLRCGGTWFVGVDALDNDREGRVAGGPALAGAAIGFIRDGLRLGLPLHRAQVSICHPGYPRPSPEETEAAFRFRLTRDAAHVDGLLAEGPERRRHLREPHAYILGIGLTRQSPDAAPLSLWQGSHHVMGQMFARAFAGRPPGDWPEIDVATAYQAARREAFAACRRIECPLAPGEAVLLHRHLLHGMAPWAEGATAAPEGRMTAYFRPVFPDLADWLSGA
jgi:hypothetical protein